jgi:hypothetical protein
MKETPMPRIAENSASLAADLRARLDRLIAAATKEGRDQALAGVRNLLEGGGGAAGPARRGPGRPKGSVSHRSAVRKGGKKRKNPWATLSPAARLARINAIRKGRGLPPRGE